MTRTQTPSSSPGWGRWLVAGLVIAAAVAVGAVLAQRSADDGAVDDGAVDDGVVDDGAVDGAGADSPSSTRPGSTDETGVEQPDTAADPATNPDGDNDAGLVPDPSPEVRHVFADGVYVGSWTGSSWSPDPIDPSAVDGLPATSSDGTAAVDIEPAEFCFTADGVAMISRPHEGRGLAGTGLDAPVVASGEFIAPAPAHIEVIEDELRRAGLDESPANVQALRLDLERDGVDEVLVVATNGTPQFYGSQQGDYAVAVLRRVVERDGVEMVDNIVLSLDVTTGDEPLVSDTDDLAPEGIFAKYVFYPSLEEATFVDLNGDGVAEIGLPYFSYEAWGTDVLDPTLPGVPVVLQSGCGV